MDTRKLSEIIYPELLTTQKLGSIPQLSNNLMLWKLKLSFVLKDYQVHHVLETPNPNPQDPSWKNAENIAKSLICSRIDYKVFHGFEKAATVKSFMEELEVQQKKIYCQQYLCEKYSGLKMAKDGDVNEHMFRMRALAKLVGFSGMEIDEKVQALTLLDSLPEDWDEDVERVMMEFHASKENLSFDNVGRRLRAANEFRKWRYDRNSNMEGGREGVKGKTSTSTGGTCTSNPWSLTGSIYSHLKSRLQLNYTGSYFHDWKDQVNYVLKDNKVDYLLVNYSPSNQDPSSHKKRLSGEFIARHLILGAMSDDLFLTFHDYPTARALMDAVETWFNSPSIAHQMLLFSKYRRHQMSENVLSNQHLLDMEIMVRKLQADSLEIPDLMQAQRVINSLPRSWSDIQTKLKRKLDAKRDEAEKCKLVDRVADKVQRLVASGRR